MSVPLRIGGDTAGVLNAVFTADEAFDVSDSTYVVLLAAIANVVLAVLGQSQSIRVRPPVKSPSSQAKEDVHGTPST